ncbi:MAG: C39 family peptidase [Peptococcaceae bacterium]
MQKCYEFAENIQAFKGKAKELPKDPTKFKKSWELLLSPDKSNEAMAVAYSTLLPVTRLYQRMSGVTWPSSSCGPTTGAMITNYWANQGYNIRNSSYYGGNAALINHLYTEMGSTPVGTTANNYGYGMDTHLNHNYADAWARLTFSCRNNWPTYETAINRGRPVALRFDITSNPNAYSSYHFVCGLGTYYEGEETYAAIKDPDGGSSNTGTHYFSWVVNENDMTMIASYYQTW